MILKSSRTVLLLSVVFTSVVILDPFADDIPLHATHSREVIRNVRNDSDQYIKQVVTYVIEKDQCKIMWEVQVPRDPENYNMTLRTRYPIGVECNQPFHKQLPLHRLIFDTIFQEWNKTQFSLLFTGPLARIEPKHTWNARIAMASTRSSDWKDWRTKYPNQRSGKSLNQIFVELTNTVLAYRELASLFNEYGLKIRLDSVEKVLSTKLKNLPFFEELRRLGLDGNTRVIYDAGMNYFTISELH
ncbi:MAG: hypothetical protein SVY10_20950 [Thermodesulfobacteriota bacterium]|nr:hypothetical protein [Thermodesulfobacteriota bacterium]